MLTMPNLSIDTTITRSESIDSTSSSSSSQFPKSMVSQMLTSPQLDIANDFYIAPKSPSMSDSPAVPQMDDWDDDELMAAMNSPPSSPMRSPSPVIDDEDYDETQAIWASNTQPSQDSASDDEIDEPSSPVADEPPSPVEDEPPSPVEGEPPSPVADEPPSPVTDTPLSIATTLAELTTDLSTAETCSQIIKVAMKLISSTRAHSKTLSSAVKNKRPRPRRVLTVHHGNARQRGRVRQLPLVFTTPKSERLPPRSTLTGAAQLSHQRRTTRRLTSKTFSPRCGEMRRRTQRRSTRQLQRQGQLL
ncbi:hypothetical protein EhV145_00323 [Emiliania huxleyi virus 145]|nr:hypothetical protein EhV145_00323 [Emiliania huxleyi virus 145]